MLARKGPNVLDETSHFLARIKGQHGTRSRRDTLGSAVASLNSDAAALLGGGQGGHENQAKDRDKEPDCGGGPFPT